MPSSRLTALLLAVSPAACQTIPVTDPASRYYTPPPGTEVVVEVPITIPAGSAHVLLQDGVPVGVNDRLQRYDVACKLEVDEVRATPQTVAPDRFLVTRTIRRQELVSRPSPVQLAGVGFGMSLGRGPFRTGFGWPFGFDDDRLAFNTVTFVLKSPRQPNVRELACTAGWAFASRVEFPTLDEMRAALGRQVTIHLPDLLPR